MNFLAKFYMNKFNVLDKPSKGWTTFSIIDSYGNVYMCNPSYISNPMKNLLYAGLIYSELGISVAELNCEEYGDPKIIFDYNVITVIDGDNSATDYFLDTNNFFIELVNDYKENREDWINFDLYSDAENSYYKEQYEKQKKEMDDLSELVIKNLKKES